MPLALIAGAVLVANALYLLHVFDPNPINEFSGLTAKLQPGLFPGGNVIDPNSGFTAQALGHRAIVDWLHGHVPWWNPYEGVGTPLAGEMQSAAFFPLTILLAFSTGQLFLHVILEMAAGWATYFLLRRFMVTRWPAVIGGIAFAVNGTFAWISHAPVNPIAFLPFLLIGIERSFEATRQSRPFGWGVIALALALSLYAGFPEMAYINGLLGVAWTIMRLLQVGRGRTTLFLRKIGAGLGTGTLLAAPILVAFVDYLKNADIGAHGSAFAYASFTPSSLPQFILPYIYGPIAAFGRYDHLGILSAYWEVGYVTTSLLALALVGAFGRRHRPLRLLLTGWIVLALAKTFAVPGVTFLMNLIPGMRHVAFYVYGTVSWEFAIIVLAALAIDDISVAVRNRATLGAGFLAALVLVAAAAIGAIPLLHRLTGAPHHRGWALASVAWGAVVVLTLAAVCLFVSDRYRIGLLSSVVCIDALAMFVVPQLSAPQNATLDLRPVAYLQSHLGTSRFFTLGPLAPDYGSYFGLGSVAVNDTPIPKLWSRYITGQLNRNVNPLTFTGATPLNPAGPTATEELLTHLSNYESIGVKYVVAPAGTELPSAPSGLRLRQVFDDRLVVIFELPSPAPYFSASPTCAVRFSNRETVSVHCGRGSILVRRELYMPGWEALVNGRQVGVTEWGGLLESIRVPRGDSQVTFQFSPPGMTLGLLALAIGTVILALRLFASVISGRQQHRTRRGNGPAGIEEFRVPAAKVGARPLRP